MVEDFKNSGIEEELIMHLKRRLNSFNIREINIDIPNNYIELIDLLKKIGFTEFNQNIILQLKI